jgi:hypothetical protein
LENGDSSFWQGLGALSPQERLDFLRPMKTHNVLKSFGLEARDCMAGEMRASKTKYWNAMLQAQPIRVGGQEITSYEALKAKVLNPIDGVRSAEHEMETRLKQLRSSNVQNDALSSLSAVGEQLDTFRESAARLPEDSSMAGAFTELCDRASILDVGRPLVSVNSRAETIESMQRQALSALKGMYRFIPYTVGGHHLYASNLAERFRDVSSAGQSIREQLEEAIQNVRRNVEAVTSGRVTSSSLERMDADQIMQFLAKAEEILNLTPESLSPPVSGA